MKSFSWIFYSNIISFLHSVSFFLTNFLIWENSKDFGQLIIFNFFLLTSLFISTILASLISLFSIKLSFIFNTVIAASSCLFIYTFPEQIDFLIPFIAIIIGAYSGFTVGNRPLLHNLINKKNELIKYSSFSQILRSVLSLAMPLLVAFLIANFGYVDSLFNVAIVYLFMGFIFIFFPVNTKRQDFNIIELMFDVIRIRRIRNIAIISFMLGITFSIDWGILDVIILEKVGSISSWSNIKVFLATISIVLSFSLRNTNLQKTDKLRGLIAIGAFLYALTPFILISDFSERNLLIFYFIQAIFSTISSVLIFNYLFLLQSKDIEFENERVSYQLFTDIFINFGQLIPIMILYVLPVGVISVNILLVAIFVITIFPLVTLGAFRPR